MFRTVPLSIIRCFSLCTQQAVWHKPLLCAQWKTPDDGQRNCPKHVEFYSKNKFEKLVHLVGFIVRITLAYFIADCLKELLVSAAPWRWRHNSAETCSRYVEDNKLLNSVSVGVAQVLRSWMKYSFYSHVNMVQLTFCFAVSLVIRLLCYKSPSLFRCVSHCRFLD